MTTSEKRIFLESKSAVIDGIPAGHLYLVLRTVEVDENGAVVTNSYAPASDQVIRGSAGGNLSVSTDLLSLSLDKYETTFVNADGSTGEFVVTPSIRHSQDITETVLNGIGGDGQSAWAMLQTFAQGIGTQYTYQVTSLNSNSVIFSVLNSAGVDLRDILADSGGPYVDSFYYLGHPGSATLIATSDGSGVDGEIISASPNLTHGVSMGWP